MSIFIEIRGTKYTIIHCLQGNEYLVRDPEGKHGHLKYNGRVEMEPGYIGKIVNWINANRRS